MKINVQKSLSQFSYFDYNLGFRFEPSSFCYIINY